MSTGLHCVLYGLDSWIVVLDWNHGVEPWMESLECNRKQNCVVERTFGSVRGILTSFQKTRTMGHDGVIL